LLSRATSIRRPSEAVKTITEIFSLRSTPFAVRTHGSVGWCASGEVEGGVQDPWPKVTTLQIQYE